MNNSNRPSRTRRLRSAAVTRNRTAGYVFIVLALLLSATSAVLLAQSGRAGSPVENERINTQQIQSVKEALIGYAAAMTSVPNTNPLLAVAPGRPGDLPCPDLIGEGWEAV